MDSLFVVLFWALLAAIGLWFVDLWILLGISFLRAFLALRKIGGNDGKN